MGLLAIGSVLSRSLLRLLIEFAMVSLFQHDDIVFAKRGECESAPAT